MRRLFSGKTNLLALLAVLVAGGAVGAIVASSGGGSSNTVKLASSPAATTGTTTATGASSPASLVRHRRRARARATASADQTVAAAARYLGLSVAQLRSQLQTGKTLAQIARETPGRTEAGLVEAVLGAQRAKLARAGSTLPQKVKLQVQVPGGPRPGTVSIGLRTTALAYLGMSATQLRSQLRAGKSLGELAAAIPGKSEAGLIAALVGVRKGQLERARGSGLISPAVAEERLARAQKTIEGYVRRERHPHRTPSGSAGSGASSTSSSSASS